MAASDPTEVFSWLKTLPLAPEYYPTLAEFQDPISYIFKIEKEASRYGICKIVPPLPAPPKKTVLANLKASLEARNNGAPGDAAAATFTTRQQQIGFCPRRSRPVQRPVWQSGERYTYQEFEAKARAFEKSYLRKCARKSGGGAGVASPLEIESMYWKATIDKPFSVEYANDMPGSAFAPVGNGNGKKGGGGRGEAGEGVNLGETAWNMRAVSRANGSLLRFMKEEIPGVTSPMVYVAMLFSWFAWHVEDHDLHSLNYLHMGAGKTWYGVPREAAVAFEEVVRVYGYNGEINPLVTFSVLGEKTTVISPEVLVRTGVPCCRLVQNAGEFVVTFPRAYHTGFSHGFNCAEAANIATPEWLAVAKDAAIRRASINYPPMVSHFQLLFDLALELCSRVPASLTAEPRSSRLKDKKKSEGEMVVKELFIRSVLENNNLLHALGKGSSIVLLPKSSSDSSLCSKFRVNSQSRFTNSYPLASCNSREEKILPRSLISDDLMIDRKQEEDRVKGFYSMKGKLASLCEGSWVPSLRGNKSTRGLNPETSCMNEAKNAVDCEGLSDHRLFSCVACGILSFACVAIIKPRDPAARYLMSADCSFFNDWVNAGVGSNGFSVSNGVPASSKRTVIGGWRDDDTPIGVHDTVARSTNSRVQMEDKSCEMLSNTVTNKSSSALGLLALNYGNSSDSEDDPIDEDQIKRAPASSESPSRNCSGDDSRHQNGFSDTGNGHKGTAQRDDLEAINSASVKANSLGEKFSKSMQVLNKCSPDTYDAEAKQFCQSITPMKNENQQLVLCDEDSSRMHVFCLEHAIEVEQQLREIGGVHIQLLCHPDYPKIEANAKAVAEEVGIGDRWNDVTFRDSTKDDEEMIQVALDSEEAMPKNGDWAVKLGINLFYSANLSRSPLYSKQMPYNSVIYNAFGRCSPTSSSEKSDGLGRRSSRQRKVVVGKWCGKVWMSNQIHPLLAKRDEDEEEDEEQEEEREKPARKSAKTTNTRKLARKRKTVAGNGSTKKVNCVKRENETSDDSMVADDAREHSTKSFRRKRTVCVEARLAKKARHVEVEDAASDDSTDEDRGGLHHLHRKILRSKQAKHARREDTVSDDSSDSDSRRVSVRIPRTNHPEHTEQDVVSDDSQDSKPNLPLRNISKSKAAKSVEREDSDTDETHGNSSQKPYAKTYKTKRAKSIETEITASPYQENKRNLRSTRTEKPDPQQKIRQEPRQRKQPAARPTKTKQRTQPQKDDPESSAGEESDDHPSTRLRKRSAKPQKTPTSKKKAKPTTKTQTGRAEPKPKSKPKPNPKDEELEFGCDVEGCGMSFGTRHELALHKRNICPVKGCGKKFFSHKYLVQHRRVHMDDRPLRCPWKGCKMTFKWAWARTEHIRVHTGARPYICAEPGCGQTFRFVSDFSRHKRKTGHSVKKGKTK